MITLNIDRVTIAIVTSLFLLPLCIVPKVSCQSSRSDRNIREIKAPIKENKFILNAQCQVVCKAGILPSICKQPPTRKEKCESIANLDWCCQEWLGEFPELDVWFTTDCQVSCGSFRICPWTRCTWCEQIGNDDKCCAACSSQENALIDGNELTRSDLDNAATEGESSNASPNDESVTTTAASTDETVTTTTAASTDESLTTTASPNNGDADSADCLGGSDILCKRFDGYPQKCRLSKYCAYNCAAGTCQRRKEIHSQPCFEGCFNHCDDPCGCYSTHGCLYDASRGSCRSNLERYCRLTYFTGNECARKNSFYSFGGRICENVLDTGDCDVDTVVASANLGSEDVIIDRYGVEYRPQSELDLKDPIGISVQVSVPPENIKGRRAGNMALYSTALSGEVIVCTNETRQCVDFEIPITFVDGHYELGIRMVEMAYSDRSSRRFSASFGNMEIFTELDILDYAEEKYHPLDLYVNFNVSNNGTTLVMRGYKPQKLGNSLKLSFCRGHCAFRENNFLVSAFHIIKQKKVEKREYCHIHPIPECDPGQFGADECRRENSYYWIDDEICWSNSTEGNCYIADVNKAVNINGLEVTDTRGVQYSADLEPHEDVDNVRRLQEALDYVQGVSSTEQPLYRRYMYQYSDPKKKNDTYSAQCVRYSFPVCQDGHYELNIKVADDESEGVGKRKFDVLIGDLAIFKSVDLFSLTSLKNKGVDLNFNFDVTDEVTKVRWKDKVRDQEMDVSPEKRIMVGFCNSNCTGNPKGFIVGSFSVVRFGEPDIQNSTCEAAASSACDCRYNMFCEFDVPTKQCIGRGQKRECTRSCADQDTSNECRRGGEQYVYASGGKLCNNMEESGDCTDKRTLLAINFGGEALTDSHGIMFQKDELDLEGKEVSTGINDRGVPEEDVELHHTFMQGYYEEGGENKDCLTYDVTIPDRGDGRYELSYKTGEIYYMEIRKRSFSLLFNEQYVVQEFEPAQERFPPDGFDLNVNFIVFGDGTKLQMDGHPPSNITNKTIPLSFCVGTCDSWGTETSKYDRRWHMGAVSIIEFAAELPCSSQQNSSCGCWGGGVCGYDTASFVCRNRTQLCQLSPRRSTECRRSGDHIFYVDGGLVCNSQHDWGNCLFNQTVIAYNLQGLSKVDSRGIVYYGTKYHDNLIGPEKNWYGEFIYKEPTGIPEQDLGLYESYIHGDSRHNSSCISVNISTTDGDGSYELSLKMMDFLSESANTRTDFSIKLNHRFVVHNFNPLEIREYPNAFDLVQMYRVLNAGTTLMMHGHPPTDIEGNSVPLEWCSGDCGDEEDDSVDTSFIAIAFAVVKYTEPCDMFHGEACECRLRGYNCTYNVKTTRCNEKLLACLTTPHLPTECRRGGDHIFYAQSGVVCPNPVAKGNCKISQTMMAVNFGDNAQPLTDVNGIMFQSYLEIPFDNPGDKFIAKKSVQDVIGIPESDMDLYMTFIRGNCQSQKGCVTYHIPTDGDGEYELSLKVGEGTYVKRRERRFSFLLNGQNIVLEFDPQHFRPFPYMFDLNANFNITGGGTVLNLRGDRASNIVSADRKIPLEFCCGNICNEVHDVDPDWQISGFSVVKFDPAFSQTSVPEEDALAFA